MLKKVLFILLFLNFSIAKAEKYALIIAIGDYPTKTGWSTISSANDVPLIKQALVNNGFAQANIQTLIDAAQNKLNALKERVNQIQQQAGEGIRNVNAAADDADDILDNKVDAAEAKLENIEKTAEKIEDAAH